MGGPKGQRGRGKRIGEPDLCFADGGKLIVSAFPRTIGGFMSSQDAKIAALEIGFVELAKFLGRLQVLSIMQLPSAMNDAAKASRASAETVTAVAELARNFR